MSFQAGQTVKFSGGTGQIIGVHEGGFQIVDDVGMRHVLSDADASSVTVIETPATPEALAEAHADIVERERKVREGS